MTRLAKLKVSVSHLQLTGIGKTVACVRKLEGEVGELAKKLVTKWKDMVAEAEKAEKMKPPVPLFSKFQETFLTMAPGSYSCLLLSNRVACEARAGRR